MGWIATCYALGCGRQPLHRGAGTDRERAGRVVPPAPPTAASAACPPPPRATAPEAGPIDFCTGCGAPRATGTLANGALDEASGLVASIAHPGIYYLHNDSGDTARFFAIDESGADLGTFELAGAKAADFEDAALGLCPAGRCIYFADVGDNEERRTDYRLYRVAEPASLGPAVQRVAYERFPFQYPDGRHDAETLLAHPVSGELVIVTKVARGPSGIYRFPSAMTAEVPVILEKVGEVQVGPGSSLVTGGDVHPAGLGVLLRTYTDLFFVPLSGESVASALRSGLCRVPVAPEPQGEAVAWRGAGDGWLTVSEGRHSALSVTRCARP